ncbi:MAG TPA: 4Fe-4S binding protein [Candidatus Aphodovivens excrementavium]|nr:4Fe-4S binding protein [Candidatus Aphodovivens excrementavium]
MKRIFAIESWCLDCKRCEIACKTFHSASRNTVAALRQENASSRVRVEGTLKMSLAVNCRHCAHPKCVEGCISGAMRKDPETGLVTADPHKCVGCRTCVSMCPYGCVQVVCVDGRDVALKCDLCSEDGHTPGTPSCVAACPNNALIYLESEGC